MNIDHIVWAVPDIDEGITLFQQKTGVTPIFGGHHTTQGTQNALIKIGPASYFEILAPDTDSPIQSNRWMGIDLIQSPRITRWAFSTTQIEQKVEALQQYDVNLGQLSAGQRKTTTGDLIKWKMTLPHHSPLIDLAPFFIDWSESAIHPTDQLADEGLSIERIELSHSEPSRINTLLEALNIDGYQTSTGSYKIGIVLNTPNGLVTFS
jgi:hypothetical protein